MAIQNSADVASATVFTRNVNLQPLHRATDAGGGAGAGQGGAPKSNQHTM